MWAIIPAVASAANAARAVAIDLVSEPAAAAEAEEDAIIMAAQLAADVAGDRVPQATMQLI